MKRKKKKLGAEKISHEFIKHVIDSTGEFVTDIWYHPIRKRYTSVVSDELGIPQGFKTTEELDEYLNETKGEKL